MAVGAVTKANPAADVVAVMLALPARPRELTVVEDAALLSAKARAAIVRHRALMEQRRLLLAERQRQLARRQLLLSSSRAILADAISLWGEYTDNRVSEATVRHR